MAKYVSLVNRRLRNFTAWQLEHISRDSKEKVDALAAVTTTLQIKETVFLPVYYQPKSSIATSRVNEIDKACPSLMTPIVCYLSSVELPNNRVDGHKIQVQAARFSLVNRHIYKRSLDRPYLKCLTHQQGQYVLVV